MTRIAISFSKWVAAYPDHRHWPTKRLLDTISGEVRKSLDDSVNTCALRLSYALNHGGRPIRKALHVHYYRSGAYSDPATVGHARPRMKTDLYVYRVLEMRTYLESQFGPGKLIYDGRHPDKLKVSSNNVTQGIVVFTWQGKWADFNASGHVDLFRVVHLDGQPAQMVSACVGNCYFNPGPMLAYLWETRP